MALAELLKKYDYRLPPELIAQAPAKPRDLARLLVYHRLADKPAFDTFKNLGKYLPKNAVLVFNQTKVWPARLVVHKITGGKVELLYISHDKKFVKFLSNRLLRPGDNLKINAKYSFTISKKEGQFYFLRPSFPMSRLMGVLKAYGITPLPPYIKHSPLTETQKRGAYQTIFAKTGLSVAAPTASLHFTRRLLKTLRQKGINEKFVRLDVGLGTFAPLKDDNLKTGKLHREFYQIDRATADFLNLAKKAGRPIIAVGTTVARTLESAANNRRRLSKLTGHTDLFIQESYKFKFVDGLITNFHVPKSSLLMLVSVLAGRKKILSLYQQAVKRKFRFFSFGDGMLIL
ncbi:MAG: tRNA preQ1(34) S-adenosylmethionine ribosyltransferase-isomerase QueA [Patescibacteria group bacterium]|nr:tRNA preQ1(34) S-adenosylmethionine ribosyltransferase-isomerase QueA [Patescibacteria group bacterium]